MALTYTRLPDPIDMSGNPVEIAWQATDEATGVSIMQNFPIGTTDTVAQTALAAAFPPVRVDDKAEPLRGFYNKQTGEVFLLDDIGKPLLSFIRTQDGGMNLRGYDSDGNAVNYTRSQVVTLSFRGTKVAKADWPTMFVRVPSISLTLTDASAQPPYKVQATKNGVAVRFSNAYTGAVECHASER